MRCFIALELPEELKNRLARVSRALACRFPEARWVRPDSHHITLAFFGEIKGTELDCARTAVQAAAGLEDSNLSFSGTELLPERGPARVLALSVGAGAWECKQIYEKINRSLADAARHAKLCPLNPEWPDGRLFRVHVTLARAAGRPFPRDISGVWEEISSWMQAPCRVSRCILYRSDLLPDGVRYEALLAVEL